MKNSISTQAMQNAHIIASGNYGKVLCNTCGSDFGDYMRGLLKKFSDINKEIVLYNYEH